MGRWEDYKDKSKVNEIIPTYTSELSKKNKNNTKKIYFVFTGPVNTFRSMILKKFENCSNIDVYDGFFSRKKYEEYVSQSKY